MFYPEDDEYLVDRETTVSRFERYSSGPGRLMIRRAVVPVRARPSGIRQCPGDRKGTKIADLLARAKYVPKGYADFRVVSGTERMLFA